MTEDMIHLDLTTEEFVLVVGALTKTFDPRGLTPIVLASMLIAQPHLQGLLDKMVVATNHGMDILQESAQQRGIDVDLA